MPGAAWIPLLVAQICLLFTLALAQALLRRARPHLLSWTVSLGCFTIGAAALWYGTAFGWNDVGFRLFYLCGAFLGVPWLGLGQLQLLVDRRRWEPVAAVVVVLSVAGGFVVACSPFLAGARLHGDRALPRGHDLYGQVPRLLVAVSNGGGTLLLLTGLGVSLARLAADRSAAGRARLGSVALVAAGAAAAGSAGLLAFLGDVSAHAVGVGIGMVLIYAGFRRGGVRVGRHRGTRPRGVTGTPHRSSAPAGLTA